MKGRRKASASGRGCSTSSAAEDGLATSISRDADDSATELMDQYRKFQILHIPNAFSPGQSVDKVIGLLHSLVSTERLDEDSSSKSACARPRHDVATECSSVVSTWNVENGSGALLRSPGRLLSELASARAACTNQLQPVEKRSRGGEERGDEKQGVVAGGRWYTSCVVQHAEVAVRQLLLSLPDGGVPAFTLPRKGRRDGGDVLEHAPCAWIFMGQNVGKRWEEVEALRGRPEHTDAIAHSGTVRERKGERESVGEGERRGRSRVTADTQRNDTASLTAAGFCVWWGGSGRHGEDRDERKRGKQ